MTALERVPGKAHARPELLEVPPAVGAQDVLDERAGVICCSKRGARVQVAGIAQHVVEFPAEAQVQSQIRTQPPVVLRVGPEIRVGIERHNRRPRGRSAFDGDRDGNITVIRGTGVRRDRAYAASEVLGRENTPAAKQVKECKGIQVLPFTAEPKGVASRHPAQRVADLVAVELRALRDAEVGAILQAREADFGPFC